MSLEDILGVIFVIAIFLFAAAIFVAPVVHKVL